MESNRIYYEIPDYRHMQTLLASQPYPQWVDFSWIELFSYHTASLMPTRNPNSRTDETGLYFGDDIKTGKNIVIDLKMLAAQHLMFVGSTGSGKTFTLRKLRDGVKCVFDGILRGAFFRLRVTSTAIAFRFYRLFRAQTPVSFTL